MKLVRPEQFGHPAHDSDEPLLLPSLIGPPICDAHGRYALNYPIQDLSAWSVVCSEPALYRN